MQTKREGSTRPGEALAAASSSREGLGREGARTRDGYGERSIAVPRRGDPEKGDPSNKKIKSLLSHSKVSLFSGDLPLGDHDSEFNVCF